MSELLDTFDAYRAAEATATQAFIAYKFGETSEREVWRLQGLERIARDAHIAAMHAAGGAR